VPDPPELEVDLADHPVILRTHRTQRGLRTRRRGLRYRQRGVVERMPSLGGRDRQGYGGGVVGPGPLARGCVRWVRAEIARVREPAPVTTFEPVDQPLGE